MKGLSLGARPGEQLRHAVYIAEPLDRLGLHLTVAVIDDFRPLVFGQLEDALIGQSNLQKPSGFLCGFWTGEHWLVHKDKIYLRG